MQVREQTWDVLAEVLQHLTYEPGSRFKLDRHDDENFALLHAYLHAPNTYSEPDPETGKRPDRYTNHEFVVPVATYHYEGWRRWIYDRLCGVALHEVGEWFQDDGERIFAPHHGNGWDPYTTWATVGDRAAEVAKAPGQD